MVLVTMEIWFPSEFLKRCCYGVALLCENMLWNSFPSGFFLNNVSMDFFFCK